MPKSSPDLLAIRFLPGRLSVEVSEDFIDINGHMNITQYLRLAAESLDSTLHAAGMGENYRSVDRFSCFAVEHHITYRAEMHLGGRLSVHSQLLARSLKALHAMVYLVDDDHEHLASTLEAVAVHVDMDTRRSTAFPDAVATRLDKIIARDCTAVDPPVCGVMGVGD